MSNSLRPHWLQTVRAFCPWNSLGKHTGVGYHFLLQGIFPNQGSNSDLLLFFFSKPRSSTLQAISSLSEPPGLSPKVYSESESCSVKSNSLQHHGPHSPWNSPGQNTGVGNLSLLQGIFPTQGSNPGLPHCRQILYQMSHKGSPKSIQGLV